MRTGAETKAYFKVSKACRASEGQIKVLAPLRVKAVMGETIVETFLMNFLLKFAKPMKC